MNTSLLATTILLVLAIVLAVLLSRLPKVKQHRVRITTIWVLGLIFGAAVALAWLGLLSYAIYEFRKVRATGDITSFIIGWILALAALGAVFVKFVNRFYEWHSWQNVSSILKELEEQRQRTELEAYVERLTSYFSTEFSEDFKRQLQSSSTFRSTVDEAMNLAKEAAVFASEPHTDKESAAFRKEWHAKMERFAGRIAETDPLAMEVILKAIENESASRSAPR